MTDSGAIQTIMEQHPRLRDKLYCRGFLLTDGQTDENAYPFYGLWNKHTVFGGATLLVHPKQTAFVSDHLLLVGHAYNPFTMEHDENEILKSLHTAMSKGKDAFFDTVSELTGVFTLVWKNNGTLCFLSDPTSEQSCYYTVDDGKFYVTTHACLVGNMLSLEKDPYVTELIKYRFYPLMGNLLPGDLSLYSKMKRVIPNHFVSILDSTVKTERFYSLRDLQLSLDEVVSRSAEIMHNNMQLIARKWEKPAVSLTGGCDSKTTLASAEGLYDKFVYFSYISNESEQVDAQAAQQIANKLGLSHKIYTIPENDDDVEDFEAVGTILRHNYGEIGDSKRNDVRKRVFFADTEDFDIEVKSWASEIGRAEYVKRFHGRTKFGKIPTPRACTSLYKFFLHNRKLVKETDDVFNKFIERYFDHGIENAVPWWEWFYWEYYQGAIGLKITGEHKYSFDITVPYNNRRLLELMLSAPLDDRINDRIHSGIRQLLDPRIDATGISVTNLKHTQNRARLENLYYAIHSKIPF